MESGFRLYKINLLLNCFEVAGTGSTAGVTIKRSGSVVEITSNATTNKWESACEAGKATSKDWNAYLNIHPPLPSHKYTINTVSYTFETDALGRVNKVTATLDNTVRGRNETQQGLAVSLKDGVGTDDGGHLIANILNGPGEQLNYVAMNLSLNRGQWQTMEAEWKRLISQTPPVIVVIDIDIVYLINSKKPDRFIVTETIGANAPFTRPRILNP